MISIVTLSEVTVAAALSLIGVAITAGLTFLGVSRKSTSDRISALEARLDKTEKKNVGLWVYCRALIDHIYKLGGEPPPAPPLGVKEMFE